MPDVNLTDEQLTAFDRIADFVEGGDDPFFVLHGLAGTGKTTLLAKVARLYHNAAMCTLTAKAASVLRGKTGLHVDTIHSTYYYLQSQHRDERGRNHMNWGETWRPGELRGQLALLDECSMVPKGMAADMLRAGARIIACGDPGQLPPVEGAQFFTRPDFTLRDIHRQALDSPIIRQAHRVRGRLRYANDGADFQIKLADARQELLDADAVIVWKNSTRKELTSIIRRLKGLAPSFPRAGEPVMCLKNCYEYGVYNGVIYTLLEPFDPHQHIIVVDVDGRRTAIPGVFFEDIPGALPNGMKNTTSFTFGYVMTCHKAQGSEYPFVLIIDEYSLAENRESWIYTALTRASKRVVIIPRC